MKCLRVFGYVNNDQIWLKKKTTQKRKQLVSKVKYCQM